MKRADELDPSLEAQCVSRLVIKGEDFQCDLREGHDEPFRGKPGLAHSSKSAEAIWGEPEKEDPEIRWLNSIDMQEGELTVPAERFGAAYSYLGTALRAEQNRNVDAMLTAVLGAVSMVMAWQRTLPAIEPITVAMGGLSDRLLIKEAVFTLLHAETSTEEQPSIAARNLYVHMTVLRELWERYQSTGP